MFVIPKTMKAVVYRGANDLRLETVPVPAIHPGELLVKVAVCGVCPTDIKKIQHGTVPPPRIFGHETAGTIVKIGSGNSSLATRHSSLKIGDRVALHHHVPCLKCHFCRHRAFAQCETYKRTGITAGFEPAGGGYTEYVRVMPFVLPGVVKIPAKNSFAEGAMLEPVNTILKAVHRLNLLPGDAVQQVQTVDGLEDGVDGFEHRAFREGIFGGDFHDAGQDEGHDADVFGVAAARRLEPGGDAGALVGLALGEGAVPAEMAFQARDVMMQSDAV